MRADFTEILRNFLKEEEMETHFSDKPFASVGVAQGEGDQVPMEQPASCSRMKCSSLAVTSLGEEHLCFDHFCGRCYELLERGNNLLPQSVGDFAALAALLYRLDECAQRALEISLSEMELNNLDRARLLDILLWSGDVTTALRRRCGKAVHQRGGEESRQELVERTSAPRRLN